MHNLQIEYLKELMNISMGAATSSVAEIFDAFGTMHIPDVSICSSSEFDGFMEKYFKNGKSKYLTRQLFSGRFSGEALFFLSDASVHNIAKHLYARDTFSEAEKIDSIMELANIINATIIGKLTQELHTQVQFSVPTAKYLQNAYTIPKEELSKYNKIIAIKTIISFEDQEIEGEILILTKGKSIDELSRLIDKKVEELFI